MIRGRRTSRRLEDPRSASDVEGAPRGNGCVGNVTAHIAELRKRAAEAEAKLKRLYDAIENGIADVSDPMLKGRVTELKAIRDQARTDAERAAGAMDRLGPRSLRGR
jgi:hypothetical protein